MNKAKKHSSPLLKGLLRGISPEEKAKMQTKMLLAAKIADLIEAKGYNKSGFAEALGKKPSEISKWLSGTQNFTVDTLTEIAGVLGVSLNELFIEEKIIQTSTKGYFTVSSTNVKTVTAKNSYSKMMERIRREKVAQSRYTTNAHYVVTTAKK